MAYSSEDNIHRIGNGFLDHSLPKAEWTHAAHFAASLWLMRYRPDLDLPRDMPNLIRHYNEAVGGVNSDTAGYHETITQAHLRAIRAEFGRRAADAALYEIVNDMMAGTFGDPGWLMVYWSKENLMSVTARKSWVDPDLRDFPY
jgi:hypothetical protein